MLNVIPANLELILRRIGRGAVYYAVDDSDQPVRWDPGTPIAMKFLGDTEGEITITPNGTMANLTLPELSGDAVHEAEYVGDNPVLEIPLFLANPNLFPVVSPTGLSSAGHQRVRPADERTVLVIPERLMRKNDGTYANLSFADGIGWQLDGAPLDAAHQTLLGLSFWLWRCYAARPTRRFLGGHGDDGKNIETVTFQGMMHPLMPDGHRIFTCGDPTLAGINIDPSVS
ncbi:MAG: hypothetical protein WDA12_05025 [Bacilli bacterium]